MKVAVYASEVNGQIRIPSSKSDAHRALICAALAFNQTSIISNIDLNDDILATLNAIKSLGASIKLEHNKVVIKGITNIANEDREFNANESGSTLRFLIPLFAHFSHTTQVLGSSKLLSRPLSVYEDITKEGLVNHGNKLVLNYKFMAGNYKIPGNVSSQFISGLLFLLPLLKEDSKIEVLPPFESKSYVEMTIKTLKTFGIDIVIKNNDITIKGNQAYIAQNYVVESDYSQCAFFASLGALKGEISCKGLSSTSLQGDKVIIDILKSMGAKVFFEDNAIISNKSNLNGVTIDLANCPDLGPILMSVSSLATGTTHFINASRLRLKESDRIASMQEELSKFGVKVKVENDEVWIEGNKNLKVINENINPHNDHRIAMAIAILAASLDEGKVIIDNAECINKSYPNFYLDLEKIGVKVVYL